MPSFASSSWILTPSGHKLANENRVHCLLPQNLPHRIRLYWKMPIIFTCTIGPTFSRSPERRLQSCSAQSLGFTQCVLYYLYVYRLYSCTISLAVNLCFFRSCTCMYSVCLQYQCGFFGFRQLEQICSTALSACPERADIEAAGWSNNNPLEIFVCIYIYKLHAER